MQRGRCLVFLIGRSGEDAVLRYTPQGTPVLRFSLATASTGRRPGGGLLPPDWHKVLVVGAKADRNNIPRKGDTCYIEGTLRTRSLGLSRSGSAVTEVFVDSDGTLTVYRSTPASTRTNRKPQPASFADAEPCLGPSRVNSIEAEVSPPLFHKTDASLGDDEWLSFDGLTLNDLGDPFE